MAPVPKPGIGAGLNPFFVAIFALYALIIGTHVALRLSNRGGIPMVGVSLLVVWALCAAVGMWAIPVTVVGLALLATFRWRFA